MNTISVIIITRNEERDIRACLESVSFADEIIVMDSGSEDQTIAICQEYNAKVFSTDWPGFGVQKQRALLKASGTWVLSIDADERVSPELVAEINGVLSSDYDGFYLLRRNYFCGQLLRHLKDPIIRLVRRDQAHFTDSIVHERLIVSGKVGRLKAPLWHHSFHDLEEALSKINSYSTASAKIKAAQRVRGGLTKALLHGSWAFIKSYFLQLGFLSGRAGFMFAVYNAEGSYYKYLKLMEY